MCVNLVTCQSVPMSLKQWLVGTYNTQILLMVFLAIVSLLLAGFFAYHANLCLTNTTTNEVLTFPSLEINYVSPS